MKIITIMEKELRAIKVNEEYCIFNQDLLAAIGHKNNGAIYRWTKKSDRIKRDVEMDGTIRTLLFIKPKGVERLIKNARCKGEAKDNLNAIVTLLKNDRALNKKVEGNYTIKDIKHLELKTIALENAAEELHKDKKAKKRDIEFLTNKLQATNQELLNKSYALSDLEKELNSRLEEMKYFRREINRLEDELLSAENKIFDISDSSILSLAAKRLRGEI